jgi:uncharacterized membrane protein YecN with MAPEG domain
MKLAILMIAVGLTWLMWGIGAICIARRVEASNALIHADYPVCVTIHNGPLISRKGVNLYPRRSYMA